MMDLHRKSNSTGVLLSLACMLAALPAAAQQAPQQAPQPTVPVVSPADEIEPGVDTSAATAPVAPAARTAPTPTPPRSTPAGARGAAQPAGRAQDRVDLDATQITGNRELPRVLYIVPWKRSDLGDLTGKPVNSLLDEVLAPVDRDVFRRETRYFDAVSAAPPAGAAGAAAVGSPAAAGATPVGDSVRDGSQAPEPGGQ
jgi:hypothetical protein